MKFIRICSAALCAASVSFSSFAADTPPEGKTLVDLTTPTSGAVSSSGAAYGDNYAASKAFDGVTSGSDNRWLTKSVADAWLVYKFKTPTAVNAYTIVNGGNGGASQTERAPKTWTFSGSNDGETWTTLDSRDGETKWASGESRFFYCQSANNVPYTYYKYQCTANNGQALVQIHEIYFYDVRNYAVTSPALTELGNGNWRLTGTVNDFADGTAKLVLSAPGEEDVEIDIGSYSPKSEISFEFSPSDEGACMTKFNTAKIVVPDGESGTATPLFGKFCFAGYASSAQEFGYKVEIDPSDDIKSAIGEAAYTNLPVLVRLSTAISGFDYSVSKWDGYDMMFLDEDGSSLDFEVESWNPQGESLVWVRAPELSADTALTCYFGCAKPSVKAKAPQNVWTNYVGVWHFAPSEAGGTTVADSTGHALHGTAAKDLATYASPFGGDALTCAGAIKTPDFEAAHKVGATFTASGWFKCPNYSGASKAYDTFVSKKTGLSWNADSGWYIQMNQSKTIAGILLTGNEYKSTIPDVTQNWNYYTVVSDGSKVKVYWNGSATPTVNQSYKVVANGVQYTIGGSGNCEDEYRIRKGAATAAEAAMEYKTMAVAAFFDYGEVESTDDSAPVIAVPTVVRDPSGAFVISAEITENAPMAGSVKCVIGDAEYAMDGSGTGTYSATVSDLEEGTHTCLVKAKSAKGSEVQRSCPTVFYAGGISIEFGQDAYEDGLVPGWFTVTRADTANDLPVSFEADPASTAVAGQTYVALASPVVIPAGTNAVRITVMPKIDPATKADATVKVNLLPGLYGIDAEKASAQLTVVNLVTPAGWNTWVATADGKVSDAANWSAGHAPAEDENVMFDGRFSNAQCEWDKDAPHTVASWKQTADFTGTVSFDTTFAAYDPDFTNMVVTGDVVLEGGTWTHHDHKGCAIKTNAYHLAVTVGGDFTIGSGAKVSANGKGARNTGNGAAYGGSTGKFSANVVSVWGRSFGSVTEPTDVGLSAAADGGYKGDDPYAWAGGAIWLKVGGTLTADGAITANGEKKWGWNSSCGSGGSIYLSAAALVGSAAIQANGGGDGGSTNNQCGSGGRIALVTQEDSLGLQMGNVTVQGGSVYQKQAGSGTIFVKTATSVYGTLYMKFNNVYGAYAYRPTYALTTDIPAGRTWTFDGVVFSGKGILRLSAGTKLVLPNGLGSVTGNDYEGGLILDGGELVVPSDVARCEGSWTVMPHKDAVIPCGLTLAGPKFGNLNLLNIAADFTPVAVTVDGPLTLEGGSSVDLYGNAYGTGMVRQGDGKITGGTFTAVQAQEAGITGIKDTSVGATGTLKVRGGFMLIVK